MYVSTDIGDGCSFHADCVWTVFFPFLCGMKWGFTVVDVFTLLLTVCEYILLFTRERILLLQNDRMVKIWFETQKCKCSFFAFSLTFSLTWQLTCIDQSFICSQVFALLWFLTNAIFIFDNLLKVLVYFSSYVTLLLLQSIFAPWIFLNTPFIWLYES